MIRWCSLGLAIVLGALIGLLGFSLWDTPVISAHSVNWSTDARWIGSAKPSYVFYARNDFYLPDKVNNAWLRLSADNDFILYINGQTVANEQSVLNNSAGLAEQISDPAQRLTDAIPYNAVSGPHTLIANTKDWKLTFYANISAYLRPGKNVIAVEIQKGRINPRFALEGWVEPLLGDRIQLTTGIANWRVSNLAETRQQIQWYELDFPDQHWTPAPIIAPVSETTYSRISANLFSKAIQGYWLNGQESSQGEVWLRGIWEVSPDKKNAFIRFASQSEYALLINGVLVSHYAANKINLLYLSDVTNLIHPGTNTITVHLVRPLDTSKSVFRKQPLSFFLDGWVEGKNNQILNVIATDQAWRSSPLPDQEWFQGQGQGEDVLTLRSPNTQEFQYQFIGDAALFNYPRYILHLIVWCLFGGLITICFACLLGYLWLNQRRQNRDTNQTLNEAQISYTSRAWENLIYGTAILFPTSLFLIGVSLLKHRYLEVERGLFFVQPYSSSLIFVGLLTALCINIVAIHQKQTDIQILPARFVSFLSWFQYVLWGLALVLFISVLNIGITPTPVLVLILFLLTIVYILGLIYYYFWGRNPELNHVQAFQRVTEIWLRWGHLSSFILIIGIGFFLRFYKLDFFSMDSDENTSYDAVRGILRTGVPETSSHIWYTRSPAFHYSLALWLKIVGDSTFNGRLFSVLWATATLVLIFLFTRKITQNSVIALIITALVAIDPWNVMFSKSLRFYPSLQFFTLLSFWLFYLGFLERAGKWYQNLFFIVITWTMLTQEVTITLLPGFFIGFLLFYRPFSWSRDWNIPVGAVLSVGIVIYDIVFFAIKCLTPWVALSYTTDSVIKLHFLNITYFFTSFFFGMTRAHTLYSLFFFLGFIYFIYKKNNKIIFLFIATLINILFLTLLSRQVATRYFYPIGPFLIILSTYSAWSIIEELGRKFEAVLQGAMALRKISLVFLILLLVNNIEPERIITGFEDSIARRNTEVFNYIREHRQPGDLVIASMPAEAAITLGGLDYYIPSKSLPFDGIYSYEGNLIDRWGGGIIINNADQLEDVLNKAQRLWIHLDGYTPTPELTKNLNSSHPRLYLQSLGEPVLESFGTRLRLWKKEDGLTPRLPNQGKDIGNY